MGRMDNKQKIADQLAIGVKQVAAVVDLLDADNTLPFIARYRKEATGGLDEEQIRQIQDLLEKLRALDDRRETVLASMEEQGKLTPELRKKIAEVETITALEDLYQPYKPKRRTRASIAKEKGLQGLAQWILKQPQTKSSLEQIARPFLNEQVTDVEQAWAGARDIVAETISDHPDVRRLTREKGLQRGLVSSAKITAAADVRGVFQTYYEFSCAVAKMRPHQVLALNRGEEEKVLRVKVELAECDWQNAIGGVFRPNRLSPLAEQMELAIADSAERLLLPAIERDIRRELSEKAETHAIEVFSANLRALLSQPPMAGQVVLGLDPGFRTGCKVGVVDPTGKVLTTGTIYPHEPQKEWQKSLYALASLVERYHVTLISIGNGTASRETEQLAAELIKTLTPEVKYLITNEAGASVYSASPLSRAELPDLDVSLRGAVSIARRVQDPLAELVKIDPKSIGVGLYQYDVDQKMLTGSLERVVESVVNRVGVEVNTASPALLAYVAGIGPKLAGKIVEYRNTNGKFHARAELRKVSGLGAKAFEQAGGFLRIYDGDNPLDASAIHPESYATAEMILARAGLTRRSSLAERKVALENLLKRQPVDRLAQELKAGVLTLNDILDQILRPGRDPRQDLPAPILRKDVLKMQDLAVGMRLQGTVRNVVDFGAFIDVGVKQDGLLHRSQLPPGVAVQVGDVVTVEIQKVEIDRGRIALSWPV